ncbi:ubiquitin elongating factor core-domain-containing protein [Baffinella frigidus]|nr:ubiquitin elongating factor core-domain-containing protein [Cryptophyta sp. CCMP2293]
MMLNDSHFCIDESLMKLAAIKKAQQDLAAPGYAARPEEEHDKAAQQDLAAPGYAARPEEERAEVESTLNEGGGQARWGMQQRKEPGALNPARWGMQQLREILEMMQMFTAHVPAPFRGPELVERVAQMLNYLLDKIAGPKCIELKANPTLHPGPTQVLNPEKFSFKPKELLSLTSDIFLTLSTYPEFAPAVINDGRSFKPEFAPAVINDGRSFKPEVLQKVVKLQRAHASHDDAWLDKLERFTKTLEGLKADEIEIENAWLDKLERFTKTLEGLKADEMEIEDALGEVPDEFEDPLMGTIMKDPVRLPSGNILDRATIARILLSDETDPYSRDRLTTDMLEEMPELKARIAEWLLSRSITK